MLTLLIVPYGIETSRPTSIHLSEELLIVPYGIETIEPLAVLYRFSDF